jgi:hypothetical protein
MGLSEFKKGLSKRAKKEGWLFVNSENICPVCAIEREGGKKND